MNYTFVKHGMFLVLEQFYIPHDTGDGKIEISIFWCPALTQGLWRDQQQPATAKPKELSAPVVRFVIPV